MTPGQAGRSGVALHRDAGRAGRSIIEIEPTREGVDPPHPAIARSAETASNGKATKRLKLTDHTTEPGKQVRRRESLRLGQRAGMSPEVLASTTYSRSREQDYGRRRPMAVTQATVADSRRSLRRTGSRRHHRRAPEGEGAANDEDPEGED